jgi:hypothetical protein
MDDTEATTQRQAKRRTTPVVVRPPRTAPLSDDDRDLAVAAIATMIALWWSKQDHDNG